MKTLVLVEDNPDDEKLFIQAVRRYDPNISVTVVQDGSEVLLWLREGTSSTLTEELFPNVIFLDIKLATCSGIDILREIRQHPKLHCIPVVMFSSSNDPRDIRDSYLVGANSFLQKPYNFEKYRTLVHEACQYWLESNLFTEEPCAR